MKSDWQKKLENKIEEYLNEYSACHDFFHAKRVLKYALEISKEIECDCDILIASALLHDTGYKGHEDDIPNHQFYSMKLAQIWLPEVGFPEDKLEEVLEAIRLHDNFSWGESYESTDNVGAKVIQDADRIESIGAIGIARLGCFFGMKQYPIYSTSPVKSDKNDRPNHSMLDQLKRESSQKWKNMNFSISKKISKEKQEIISKYYEDLKNELEEGAK